MLRSLVLMTVLLLGAPKGGGDAALIGNWGLDGHPFLVFKADGTGTMEGENFTWSSDGKVINLKSAQGEADKMSYQVKDGQLALVAGGIPMALTRIGGKASAKVEAAPAEIPGKRPVPKAEANAAPRAPKAGRDELSKLLVSSAWCSFQYNKISGSSSSSRVVFAPDGTWGKGARAEGYSSGSGGTFASQHDSADSGRWKVENGQLMMSSGASNGQFAVLPLTVTRNSNGYPLLNGNGQEWSSCQ